jgi:flagellar hook protein FlgE
MKHTLWLSLPDDPETQDASLADTLTRADSFTTDAEQALRFAKKGYAVKRRDRRNVTGEIVTTKIAYGHLITAKEFGFEMRGEPELNRP